MRFRARGVSGIQDRSAWMALLFIVVGVLAPTACVFWFMNDAARNQEEATRLTIREAYRGQMHLLGGSIDSFWRTRWWELSDSPVDFQRIVTDGLADSVVYSNSAAAASPESPSDRASSEASVAASVAQTEIRALLRAGQKASALRAIRENFITGPAAKGSDSQGRLIAADEQLLAIQLMDHPTDRQYVGAVNQLATLLNDYRTAIPPAQRLFLMDRLEVVAHVTFPTFQAERLRAQFLELEGVHPGDTVMQPSRIPGIWKLTTKSGKAIALYRTETILASARGLVSRRDSSEVQFTISPPDSPAGEDSLAASSLLPGWQISFSLPDRSALDALARQRTVSYFYVGYLVIGTIAVTGMIFGQSFRRQVRLARLKTDLVAAVSHELKTPLAAMRVLVDSLLDDDNDFRPQKSREYLQLISSENARLSRMIDKFLTFSRIERRRQQFEFRETRPSEVVQAAANAMRELFASAHCRLDIEIQPGLPGVNADPDALVTVLLNLLENAYKYTREDKRICLRAYCEASHVVFAVEDNGIGIAAREHKRIFRRFYQVDRRLTRETGGCGLGLTIVDFIVRAHGGLVRVQSELGVGSAFHVMLPCAF